MQKIVSYRLINFLTDPEHLFSRIFSSKKKIREITNINNEPNAIIRGGGGCFGIIGWDSIALAASKFSSCFIFNEFWKNNFFGIQSSSLLILELVTGSGTRKSRLRIQEVSLRNGFSPSLTIYDNLWAYFNFFQRIAWQLGIVEIWKIMEYWKKFVEKIRKAVISCYQIHFI